MSKDKKTLDDKSKMLQKVQEKIRSDIEFELEQIEYKKLIAELDTNSGEQEPVETDKLLGFGYKELVEEKPKGFFSSFQKGEKDQQMT